MENFLNLCSKRRSVRSFLPNLPTTESIQYIMECVRLAPSAVNFQPWHFRYITQPEKLDLLKECYPREWFGSAPACFIAYRNSEEEWVRRLDNKAHGDIDLAISIEHLCLAAAEQGLGTCWVCNFNIHKIQELFPTKDELSPIALIPIGYPADQNEDSCEKKRKKLEEIFSYE